jgi:cytochrome c-type biogenesis protein CcmH
VTTACVRGFAIALTFVTTIAGAQKAADLVFDARLKRLESELRCLVCQNQTLADSNAPLAEDLRREVRELASSGKSDDEIKQYLVARYGDFVLYKPPIQGNTWLLWFGPFALLLGGGAIWYAIVRRRSKRDDDDDDPPPPASGPPNDAIAKARLMLYEEP